MKKILIVAEYFAPNNEVASIRTTKLAKYFKLKGCYIGVMSRKLRFYESIDSTLQRDLKYVDEHFVISDSWFMQRLSLIFHKQRMLNTETETTSKTTLKSKIINRILTVLFLFRKNFIFTFYETAAYSRKAKKQIKKISKCYDVILTSSGPFSANILGYAAKKNNPAILWVADFRDPLIGCLPTQKQTSFYHKLQKEIIKKADVITGVSDACVENFRRDFKRNITTICNGFDKDDINNIDVINSKKFTLTYAGALYNGKRDLSIVFKIINELANEYKINKNNITVNYLGRDEVHFFKQAEDYNMQDICQTFGKVDREKSLQLQLSSHILLLASWNNTGDTGIITGKFLEYMMINKPIVCSVMGNLPNSVLKKMITEANNGIVWEQANDEIDYPILKEYILKQYKQYEDGLFLNFIPNKEYINQFQYNNIVNKFIEIIEDCEYKIN